MFLNLKPGAIIDVVATSCGDKEVSVSQVKEFIKNLGYTPRIPDDLQTKDSDIFCANTDELRYNHLLSALQSQDSDVIWIFRGGYGATRLIPLLDQHDFSANPKILIGFSDITALAIYFEKKYNWKFIHGRMISNYVKKQHKEEEFELIKNVLSGNWTEIKYELTPLNQEAKKSASIVSKITGGNMCLIECSLGTNWQIDTKNKILFLEEVHEPGYRIDRSLQHMLQAGCFNGIDALIIGNVSCVPEKDGSSLCEPAISRFIESLDIPVFKSNKFGHGEDNYPLLLNYEAHLVMGKNSSLVFKNTLIDEH